MEKFNIAELLKDCPTDMVLDCTMYEDVYFDFIDELNIIHCYIHHGTHKTSITFNQHGTPNSDIKSKCVIFPTGKTTWEGFVPPCKFKDGDVLTTDLVHFIFKSQDDRDCYMHCNYSVVSDNFSTSDTAIVDSMYVHPATKEQSDILFQKIKEAGYKWNVETKTLESLIAPKLKVEDVIQYEPMMVRGIDYTTFSEQDGLELAPNKFDINTLIPFESKVLVRHNKDNKWTGSFFSFIDRDLHSHCYKFVTTADKSYPMMIPYKGNEHLLGKTDDCDDFYKTWE